MAGGDEAFELFGPVLDENQFPRRRLGFGRHVHDEMLAVGSDIVARVGKRYCKKFPGYPENELFLQLDVYLSTGLPFACSGLI